MRLLHVKRQLLTYFRDVVVFPFTRILIVLSEGGGGIKCVHNRNKIQFYMIRFSGHYGS